MPMLTRRIPSQSSQGLSETRKLNGYFQEVFETYEEWMPMATIHAHVLDYMKEDGVSAEFWPPIEMISTDAAVSHCDVRRCRTCAASNRRSAV